MTVVAEMVVETTATDVVGAEMATADPVVTEEITAVVETGTTTTTEIGAEIIADLATTTETASSVAEIGTTMASTREARAVADLALTDPEETIVTVMTDPEDQEAAMTTGIDAPETKTPPTTTRHLRPQPSLQLQPRLRPSEHESSHSFFPGALFHKKSSQTFVKDVGAKRLGVLI